ncbi:bifunctional diguanylate cyclase/phosphodiesterase [Microvirga sp. 17 mud 1-3]|uniref:putative bifunctional diguanylate cyclase/phosphodiesterase n=1 Tax=Microvirga sp. 17 mud 1-3 TaxID=2082949 RepID=UPI000D6DBD1C|nr:EAL domain-containing protein [Microvirga sp. 17 mud 1-3]AWM85365.1 diguanylate cyclase [Microvirga sp. 17 mud 1-3]
MSFEGPSVSLRILKAVLAIVIACFLLSAAYISSLVVERQEALKQVSRYNTSWLASQAVSEFTRLEQRLSAFAAPGGGVDADEVALRYDILVSRAKLLDNGEFQDFVSRDPERVATVELLSRSLAAIQPLIQTLDEPGNALKALTILQPLETKVTALASAANHYGAQRVTEDQHELIRLHWLFSSLAGGLIVCGFILLGLLGWHNRLLTRAHHDLRFLAENLQRTSEELKKANKALGNAYAELQHQNGVLQIQEIELRTQNERFNAALNNMSQGLCMVDGSGHIIVFNARFADLFDLDNSVRPGTTLNELIAHADARGREGAAALRQICVEQQDLIRNRRNATFVQGQPGGRTIAVSHQPMSDGGWVATYEDITERRQAETQIAYMAHHDALTGLANRVLFREQMLRVLAQAQRQSAHTAVLCLDLDRFKDVNDSLGHEIGDELLKVVAQRLGHCVREEDVVARLGGDEFAVLQIAVHGPHDCAVLAMRIVESLSAPYEINGQEIVIGTSIGIALATEGSLTPDQLLKHADLALYRAKAVGRGTFRFFEPEMDAQLQARRVLEIDLRKALPNGEFELFYQPQVDIRKTVITGYEALLRWRHPERGIVSPAEFIPIAEDIGLISPLGEWVVREACREAARWPAPMKVAVNLSPVQFRNRNLVQSVRQALESSGLSPSRLELEITESVLLQDNDTTLATLHQLRKLGVRIAMDDFGTGYSSLSYLRSFPFDKIKIDQSFVQGLSTRADCLAIVQSIAGLGTSLGMSTVAEGVETEDQLMQLRAAGCAEAQGYYFGRPKPARDLTHTLEGFGPTKAAG